MPKRQNWLFNLEHKNSLALLDISKPHPRREEVEIQHFFWSKDKIWNLNHLKNIFVGNNITKNLTGVLQEGDFPAKENCIYLSSCSRRQMILWKDQLMFTRCMVKTWNLKLDQLTFKSKKQTSLTLAEGKLFKKRKCLPERKSLYDLSGIMAPVHLKARFVFQKSYEMKMDWDKWPLHQDFWRNG